MHFGYTCAAIVAAIESKTGIVILLSSFVFQNMIFIPGLGGKTIDKLLNHFGTEMTVLHKLSNDDIEAVVGSKIAKNIVLARDGKMNIVEGGGGVYGKVE